VKDWTINRWDDLARQHGHASIAIALIHWYVLGGQSAGTIGRKLKCSRWTVDRLLRESGIERRGPVTHIEPGTEERRFWDARLEELNEEIRKRLKGTG